MKIAVAVETNNSWDSIVSPRFGRAPFFAIIDLSTNPPNLQIMPNPHIHMVGGLGPTVVQWLVSMGVKAIIVSRVGPHAMMALQAMGVEVKIVPPGIPLRQALSMSGYGGLVP